jgi:pyruvate-ferredoxin/flavodoxin oxidoreductase
MPQGAISVRIHSVGGWGAITMGKNLSMTVFELLGMHIKANPKYGSEKKGQPTTFYATFAHEPIRLNCELRHVDVVLAPDPNVFRHSNPLAGLSEGGAFIIQGDQTPEQLWDSLPAFARRTIRDRRIRLYTLDAFAIASGEASDAELRYRMQGAAFMGAFFATSTLMKQEELDEPRLFEGIRALMARKFGAKGERVVEDNLRVIRRGFDEVREVVPPATDRVTTEHAALPVLPGDMDHPGAEDGITSQGRFWEQVCFPYKMGDDPLADPFAALSAVPAATSAIRDMTDVRFEVPEFIAEKCTGCSQCWTQCPDSAIPGLVSDVHDVIDTAIRVASNGTQLDRVRQVSRHLAKECQKLVAAGTTGSFGDLLGAAYETVAPKLGLAEDRRQALDAEFERVRGAVADFHLARTAPFFDTPERREKGSGGLLSVVINPEACKGCNLCVEVCPDGALVTVKQDEDMVARLRRRWEFWHALPDTPDRFINVSDMEQGIGVLPTLLLKKKTYRSMVGGDGACMGCGEKTSVHLVVSAITAMMAPRVARRIERLDELIAGLDARARGILASDAHLDHVEQVGSGRVAVELDPAKRAEVDRLSAAVDELKDLRWRYAEGATGMGRSSLAMTNSTGCSSVWGSTFPYNPYPFPWANHLFQDAPSLAIGVFEGHMRKMGDGFAAVRRAELLLSGDYDPATHDVELHDLDWSQFSDEEFALCPPIVAMGGDGAMLDIGFQNLSRLLASGKPIRVIVLDTQVYSNTGGQACTSGFTGQVSDMAAWGSAQHGKTEVRKELALIAIAHRGVFVHQTSQASASHLMGGVLRAMQVRRPAIVNIYTPCPVEHGLGDEWAQHASRLALESRAFPYLTYDPDAGGTFADCLSLDGNPSLEDDWPSYTLEYVDDAVAPQSMELPLTIADWAAMEGRFRKHFKPIRRDAWTDELIPFHEYLTLSADDRQGRTPFIHTLDRDRRLTRQAVSSEMVRLAEERRLFWGQLRELAGVRVSATVRQALTSALEADFDARTAALRAEYEARMADLRATYPVAVARRLAEGLLRAGAEGGTLADFLSNLPATTPLPAVDDAIAGGTPVSMPASAAAPVTTPSAMTPAATPAAAVAAAPAAAPAPAGAPASAPADDDGPLTMDPYIDTERCTTCNECTNLNNKLFAYNRDKQAYIKDPRAGTFQQLVLAAERCPVLAIHPGTPLNPNEKDLEKWVKRAQAF